MHHADRNGRARRAQAASGKTVPTHCHGESCILPQRVVKTAHKFAAHNADEERHWQRQNAVVNSGVIFAEVVGRHCLSMTDSSTGNKVNAGHGNLPNQLQCAVRPDQQRKTHPPHVHHVESGRYAIQTHLHPPNQQRKRGYTSFHECLGEHRMTGCLPHKQAFGLLTQI